MLLDWQQDGDADRSRTRQYELALCLVLTAVVLAVFWKAGTCAFVNFDDDKYVTENPHVLAGLTRDSIAWAFSSTDLANWHPLTWLSHMADCQLYGLNPRGHHLTSVFLHAANAMLLFLVFMRMTGALWRSALVAALFALHPAHVESVAWVSERKDVLSGLFWMLTLLAYAGYVHRPGLRRYLVTLALFALGLMAKPMLVSLPFVLILLDYWPFNRYRWGVPKAAHAEGTAAPPPGSDHVSPLFTKHPVLEKIPFLALSLASSIFTYLAQQKGGTVSSLERFPALFRMGNALVSYVKYISMMFWPSRLAVIYPVTKLPVWQVVGAGLFLVAATVTVVRAARRWPFLVVGWLWFLGMLVPVIGVVQVGAQAMADRYTYLPFIGLFIMISWGMTELVGEWHHSRVALAVAAVAVLAVCALCTVIQLGYWQDSVKLFARALDVTRNNATAHVNLASALAEQGRTGEAIVQQTEALRLAPTDARVYTNMGIYLAREGKVTEAIRYYLEALRLKPDDVNTHDNLGVALARTGRIEEALAHFADALRLKPDDLRTHDNLGVTLAEMGRFKEAYEHFSAAVRLNPYDENARRNLQMVRQYLGTAP
jgi:Flp pilus assembly protein TadD